MAPLVQSTSTRGADVDKTNATRRQAQAPRVPEYTEDETDDSESGSSATDDVKSANSIDEGSDDSDDADNLPAKSSKGKERAIPRRRVDSQQQMPSSLTTSHLEVSTRYGSSVDQSAGASPHDDSPQGAIIVSKEDIFHNPWAKGEILLEERDLEDAHEALHNRFLQSRSSNSANDSHYNYADPLLEELSLYSNLSHTDVDEAIQSRWPSSVKQKLKATGRKIKAWIVQWARRIGLGAKALVKYLRWLMKHKEELYIVSIAVAEVGVTVALVVAAVGASHGAVLPVAGPALAVFLSSCKAVHDIGSSWRRWRVENDTTRADGTKPTISQISDTTIAVGNQNGCIMNPGDKSRPLLDVRQLATVLNNFFLAYAPKEREVTESMQSSLPRIREPLRSLLLNVDATYTEINGDFRSRWPEPLMELLSRQTTVSAWVAQWAASIHLPPRSLVVFLCWLQLYKPEVYNVSTSLISMGTETIYDGVALLYAMQDSDTMVLREAEGSPILSDTCKVVRRLASAMAPSSPNASGSTGNRSERSGYSNRASTKGGLGKHSEKRSSGGK